MKGLKVLSGTTKLEIQMVYTKIDAIALEKVVGRRWKPVRD